jgi:hypothetical protein
MRLIGILLVMIVPRVNKESLPAETHCFHDPAKMQERMQFFPICFLIAAFNGVS